MGHGHARGQESHQPDAHRESLQEDHRRRGAEASLDLRKIKIKIFFHLRF